jgi:MinD-like ATPase involved in chromosome partitioning or flagellar assembly
MVMSSKGGVGKTTVAVNLATALQVSGRKTILVAGDTINPFVFKPESIAKPRRSMKEWLNGEAELKDSVHTHIPTGLSILGMEAYGKGDVEEDDYTISNLIAPALQHIDYFESQFLKEKYEFVITDTRPGYHNFEISQKISEALLITLPDRPSLGGIKNIYDELVRKNVRSRIVLNMVKGKDYEIKAKDVEKTYGEIFGILPEDEVVDDSGGQGIPAVLLDGKAQFSVKIVELAKIYAQYASIT